MGAITGANAKAGMKTASTWGTASQLSTGDQLDGFTIAPNENSEALRVNPIGSGLIMQSETDKGATAPSAAIEGPLPYDSALYAGIKTFFGTESVVAQGSGAFAHSFLMNETLNGGGFVTLAAQLHSAVQGAVEFPTAAVSDLTLTFPNPPDYITAAMTLLGNEYKIATPENTYLELNSVTPASYTKRMVWDFSDEFLINVQSSGALTSPTDRVSIASATLSLSRPQESPREARGTSGNAAPISTGEYPLTGTLTVEFRSLQDFTFITAHQAGTEYKASLRKTGASIGGGNSYGMLVLLPRLKIVVSPETGLAESGNNPLSVTFDVLVASTVPTGMLQRYPSKVVINTKSTAY
jgi:hypothetical protein